MRLQGFEREYLASLFAYDPDTGVVTRSVERGHHPAGAPVGTVDGKGYLHVNVDGKFVRIHRLAYFLHTGEVPAGIDHDNGVRFDNRFLNLRPCNQSGNSGNIGRPSHNTSGYKGVSRQARSGKWHAQIKVFGRQTYLGRDESPHVAALLYNAAAVDHFGEFARFNLLPA